jgi:acetoin utilization deacetylase AcuC-like enzyme
MTTLLYTHPDCLAHDPGEHHPESPDRLRAVLAALAAEEFAGLERLEAPRAALDVVALVHDRGYVDALLDAVPASGHAALDPDTVLSPRSGESALRAAGAVCAAVDAVIAGEARNAFCAVRPPGHHAEPDHAMGFCLFNSVAIGARHALGHSGIERVAVIDFDVHHGNGTQAMFESDADLFYASTHQSPLYPGTGASSETGVGNIVNAPLRPNSGSPEFRYAFGNIILPALADFRPDFLIVSAGFDAHRRDPLAQLNLTEDDYDWVTRQLTGLAERLCGSRLVSSLEGGYDLQALGASAAAHVRALMAA